MALNSLPNAVAVRRPGSPPAVGAQNAIDCILARLADVGDPLDPIDAEVREWAASMLTSGESAGGRDTTSRRIAPAVGAN